MNRCATYQEMSFIKGEVLIARGTGLNVNFLFRDKSLNHRVTKNMYPDPVYAGIYFTQLCCYFSVLLPIDYF
jgi:hypothetical protein